MTRERIEDMREVVLPFVKKRLLETNYEGLGESDAKEFEREFNEILNLALKALEKESILDKIKKDVKEWYWQADKQRLVEDPCVVDAMIDLFIRTIDKYKGKSEE